MSSEPLFIQSMDILATIPQYQTFIGIFVALWLVWILSKRFYAGPRIEARQTPSDEEMVAKLAEWRPEPLIKETDPAHPSLNPKIVESRIGKRITVDGTDCLNLATHNYLGFSESKEIQERAIETVAKYGVGSCGPRGFYGTVDVHLELEERLAEFTRTEEAVVYSYGFSAVASAIPAYCKRRDIVFADEKVNFAVQKGLDASRSQVRYFCHNDTEDLERLLEAQAKIDAKEPKKAGKIRRFLIVEGIYLNTGLICPLPKLVELCRKYKLRIFVDESVSFGSLGRTGKGVTEHFGLPGSDIDMIMGSLEWAMSSIGGFCVGSSFVIEHQRLSGLGYCFSASLPPLLTSAAITALDMMEERPKIFEKLSKNCRAFDRGLRKIEFLEISGIPESPIKHVYLRERTADEATKIDEISNKCLRNGLAIIAPAYLPCEWKIPRPSLRICVSVLLDDSDIEFALKTLTKCAKQVINSCAN